MYNIVVGWYWINIGWNLTCELNCIYQYDFLYRFLYINKVLKDSEYRCSFSFYKEIIPFLVKLYFEPLYSNINSLFRFEISILAL